MGKKIIFFIKYYFPILFWAGLIFSFSSVSGLKTGSENLYMEVLWRKLAHIGEYAFLAILIFRLFYYGLNYEFRDSFIAGVSLSGIYAISDEIHQSFISERSGKIADAAVDVAAAALAIEIWGLFFISEEKIKRTVLSFIWGIFLFIPLVFIFKETQLSVSQMELQKTLREKNEAVEKNLEINNSFPGSGDSGKSDKIIETKNDEIAKGEIPEKFQIKAPFTPQAPFANWDDYHQEACEEASLIMLKYFLDEKSLTPEIAEKEIMRMINFQIERYGDYRDSSAEDMIKLYGEFYGALSGGKKLEVIYDFKREDLKKYISLGFPVVVTAAGRMLGNPNYTAPGPPYHVLLATGYDKNIIVTNDPGTRKGENYRYNLDVFYNAIHDFPGNLSDMEKGRKAILVVR